MTAIPGSLPMWILLTEAGWGATIGISRTINKISLKYARKNKNGWERLRTWRNWPSAFSLSCFMRQAGKLLLLFIEKAKIMIIRFGKLTMKLDSKLYLDLFLSVFRYVKSCIRFVWLRCHLFYSWYFKQGNHNVDKVETDFRRIVTRYLLVSCVASWETNWKKVN